MPVPDHYQGISGRPIRCEDLEIRAKSCGLFMVKDHKYMAMALKLAEKARGSTYPNPMVGAVIVKGGRIVGKGYHEQAGKPHAEILALRRAGVKAKGAVMYVTLEPCDHFGRTPPCSAALIEAGIKEVVIGMKDPNPLTAGKGIRRMRRAGIKVRTGVLKREAEYLGRKYSKFMLTGTPWVTFKTAQSLDGKISAADGSSKWISSDRSLALTRSMRPYYDAIIIGAGTAVKDDPWLLDEHRKGYGVLRVVVDTSFRTPFASNLVKSSDLAPLLIATTNKASSLKIRRAMSISGVCVVKLTSKAGKVSLNALMKELGKRGIVNVLLEGGGELAGAFLDEGLIDEYHFYIAPKVIGGANTSIKGKGVRTIKDVSSLHHVSVSDAGGDIVVKGLANKLMTNDKAQMTKN